jgi:hypothetical protein
VEEKDEHEIDRRFRKRDLQERRGGERHQGVYFNVDTLIIIRCIFVHSLG